MTDIEHLLHLALEKYDRMNPRQKEAHHYEQRRSFARGMCPSNRDYAEWCRAVDKLMPPIDKTQMLSEQINQLKDALRLIEDASAIRTAFMNNFNEYDPYERLQVIRSLALKALKI